MTLRSILSTLALVAVATFGFLRPTAAQSQAGAAPAPGSVEACKQKCFDKYDKNVNDCKKTAKVCDFWILWICTASHTDMDVFEACKAAAKEVLDACLAECGGPPPQA
jgi:hypothetical protein